MNAPRKALVGMLLALSLFGFGAAGQPSAAATNTMAGDRWCC